MSANTIPLAHLLDNGTDLARVALPEWDDLIRCARSTGLLGRLRVAAADAGVLGRLPEPVARHLESAWLLAERQRESACWEIERLHSILYPAGIPLILLKGAAYAFTGHAATRGRTFQDIDILVPAAALREVERILGADGWVRKQVTAHDRRYYEEWMHEIPPMRQVERGTTLDVHRAITPPVGRYPVDTARLLDEARAVSGWDDLYVLSPEDQFLHAVAHLFLEEEFHMGYRDMVDLRLLYHAACEAQPHFAERLAHRAETLGLGHPLKLAGNALASVLQLQTPLAGKRGPVDALFDRILPPGRPGTRSPVRSAAEFIAYLRGHALKLPLRLLIPHLAYKALFAGIAQKKQGRGKEKAANTLRQMIGTG